MPNIVIDGNELELGDEHFLELISNTIIGALTSSEMIYMAQAFGFPDTFQDVHSPYMFKNIESLQMIEPQCEDDNLRNYLQDYRLHVSSLMTNDRKITDWIGAFTGLSHQEILKRSRGGSLQTLDEDSKPTGNAAFPIWVENQEFQSLLDESTQIMFASITDIENVLDRLGFHREKMGLERMNEDEVNVLDRLIHLKKLLVNGISSRFTEQSTRDSEDEVGSRSDENSGLVPDLNNSSNGYASENNSDQEAKDLIDLAEGKIDPEAALNLFRKALEYGQTGFQANKAYLGIATTYEELGNLQSAIEYYSKAIDTGFASAITFYWRGRAYFRLGKYKEAQEDLVKALNFTQDEGFLPQPDRNDAERLIAEIDRERSSKNRDQE